MAICHRPGKIPKKVFPPVFLKTRLRRDSIPAKSIIPQGGKYEFLLQSFWTDAIEERLYVQE
jgi:hypothetical protein